MAYKDVNIYKYLRFLIKRKLYFAIQRSKLVWNFINREGAKEFSNIIISPKEQEIANQLKKDGIAICNLNDIFNENAPKILNELQKKAEILKSNSEVFQNKKGTKDFFTHLSGIPPVINTEEPEIRLTYATPILNIASGYFGFVPKLHNAGFILTHITPDGTEPTHSQRWHRDPEDKKILKVFVYLTDNDANDGAGPLNYVVGSNHKGKWGKIFPQSPPAGSYPPIEAVEKKITKKDIRTAFGKTGTIVFCDTFGLHKGGYATKKERLQFVFGYVSVACFSPPKFIYPEDFEEKTQKLNLAARYALKKWPH